MSRSSLRVKDEAWNNWKGETGYPTLEHSAAKGSSFTDCFFRLCPNSTRYHSPGRQPLQFVKELDRSHKLMTLHGDRTLDFD